jgi:hypothetical protein
MLASVNDAPGGAAPKCSNQTDLRSTLTAQIYSSDLPQRPSLTTMHLVCIEKARHGGLPMRVPYRARTTASPATSAG